VVAKEHFEKGLLAEPDHVDLLLEFARFLQSRGKNTDRAAKLALRAVQLLENAGSTGGAGAGGGAKDAKVDAAKVKEADKLLASLDPKRATLEHVLDQLESSARGIAERYLAAGRPMMAMEVSSRLGSELNMPSLYAVFEAAAKKSGRSLSIWQLAYNEKNFDGWIAAGTTIFKPDGAEIVSQLGDAKQKDYSYEFLIQDTVTSGDFSFEAELLAENNLLSFAGLVFGKKASSTFHTLVYYPGRLADPAYNVAGRQAAVDLSSFYGTSEFKLWRHNVLPGTQSGWHRLRVDVVGVTVDVWCDGELVVSQDFPSLDVLRGSFGLITGPGQARWRNVHYLARTARDPSALIERELTMQRLKDEALKSGKPVGSSFVGLAPPFPTAVVWVKADGDPPESFEQAGSVPQLLVFFSIQQNDKIPIHGWVDELTKKFADVGLRAICIASPDDVTLEEYLQKHPFPGAVGFDTRPRSKQSYGLAFEQFFIPRFELPRVLLLDVDQRVAWEGPPGFELAKPWSPGAESYLDAPLNELVAKRHLREIKPWLKAWDAGPARAFSEGDLATALPLLKQAEAFQGALEPTLADVQQKMKILRAAIGGIEGTVHELARANAEAAVPALLQWAELLGTPVPDETKKIVRKVADTPNAKAFAQLVEKGRALKKSVLGKDGVAAVKPFIVELQAGPAPLAPIYGDRLNAVLASSDPAQVAKLLDNADVTIPARWLARSFFHW
jgi:hypothetical protein